MNVLITEVGLSAPVVPGEANPPKPQATKFHAIWDTGATGTVITKAAAAGLGLVATGQTEVHGVHGGKVVSTYIVDLHLPNGATIPFVEVTECDALSNDGKCNVLIGMNVISLGDFAVTNKENNTVMTFCMPSHRNFDFVKDIHENRIMPNNLNRTDRRAWEKKHGKA
ncbi:MAG: aspartyl protease family protein [Fibrobacteria bacterium]